MIPDNELVRGILGRMCFECTTIAKLLRKRGDVIKTLAEDEQAAVILFLLNHYLATPEQYPQCAEAELKAIYEQNRPTNYGDGDK